jgi:hypothetical protein
MKLSPARTTSAVRIACAMGVGAGAWLSLAATSAWGATSITNSLTGFTGNSTQTATQNALGAVGLGFTSTAGFSEDPPGTFVDPTVQFDSSGALFGGANAGDPGRNFIRTTQTDYANVSFTAEVSWVSSILDGSAAYFGLGSAQYGNFRIADWGTQNSAAQLFIEATSADPDADTLINTNGNSTFVTTDTPELAAGTNRLRMAYDWFQKKATFTIDFNYAGGAFTADVTLPAVSTLGLYSGSGWPTEASRVYFGGDDGSTFKDLAITVTSSPIRLGDFNQDGNLTAADWSVLRNNQHANLSGMTLSEAYALGDVTADLANNYADFILFKDLYNGANGVGAFEAMAASVPEPSSVALVAMAGLLLRAGGRRYR